MVRAGVSVFRLNFSHGTRSAHERMVERIRKIPQARHGRVAVLQDLEGHRIRTGRLRGHRPIMLTAGERLRLCREPIAGSQRCIALDYPGPLNQIHPRQMVYIDDGRLHLQVVRSGKDVLETVVVQGGALGERKGVNIPGVSLVFLSLSEKDASDLEFAVQHRVEYVAQSFVRSAADVVEVKRRLAGRLPRCRVIAKIESRRGINHMAAILRAADGIMIARGDLGISVPIHEIPILQKWMIAACNHLKKPVITATQMLEQMITLRQPTRAEVSDIANAVIDGSDFVMLSGETAIGKHPVEAVRMMQTIIAYTEHHAPFRGVRRTR